jgi:PAS domain S-box-containing protein
MHKMNLAGSAEEVSQLKSQVAALEQLLEVHERTTIEQSEWLEEQNEQLQEQATELEAQAEELQSQATQLEEYTAALEERRREMELQRARLADLFQNAPAFIAVLQGPNHVFEIANPPYLQLVGDRAVLGRAVAEALPEVVEQGFAALLDQVYTSGEPFLGNEVPILLRRAPGAPPEERFVNFVYQPVREVDGAVGGIFVHGVDVTDQVEARRQVEQLEERLRLALEAADVGTYDWDVVGGALSWDRRARHIFGVPEEGEVSYETFEERVDPEDRELANRVVQQALDPTGKGEFATEYRVVYADGSLHWVRALGHVYFEGEGSERRAVRFLGTVQDVTEQRELQHALEAERARLREVFQQAPALIAVLRGPQHIFEIANPPYLGLLGNREVLGRPIREALPELEGQGYFEMLDGVYQTGEPVVGNEMRALLDRTGGGQLEEGYFNFVFHPLRETDGAVGGILIHAVEVTEQVRARQEIERKAEELARTARALEATNRELDQFAYVASHDLKAPLRGIANLSQWIEEDIADALSDENREQMQMLRGRVHRMEALIEGILQYSRAGRATGKPEVVDTGALVREVTDLLDPPEHFAIEIADDMPMLETERLPLQQVFMNLIGNAIKYTERPDARVEISAREVGDYWDFSVADSGPGIAPEYHDKIFAIFQRLEARDQVEGTGIGLSLVKKIVEGRRGRVWVESQEGHGTTFRFSWLKTPERNFSL